MIFVRMPRACISRAALRSGGVMKDSSVPDAGKVGAAQPGKIKAAVSPQPINVFMPSFRCLLNRNYDGSARTQPVGRHFSACRTAHCHA